MSSHSGHRPHTNESITQTSATITIAIYLLTMHPEVLARLRKEVIDTVGSVNPPTYDDLREMKYLRAVINGMFL